MTTCEYDEKDFLQDMIDYESGEMETDRYIRFFAYLIRTGQAWRLQGMYGRTAAGLIESGIIDENGNIL